MQRVTQRSRYSNGLQCICLQILISVLLMLTMDTSSTEGVCDVLYMKEPFPSVECNPYSASSMFSLQCQVRAPAPVIPRLEILWFFTNTSDDTVQVSAATLTSFRSIVNQTGMSGQLLTSTITFGPFTNPIHAGGYFCQVALDDNAASFSASTVQTYTNETDILLNENPCGGSIVHTRSTIICAGNISYFVTSTLAPSKTLSAIYMASLTITSTITLSPPLATSNTTMLDSQGETTISQLQTSRPVPIVWVYILVGVVVLFFFIIIVLLILYIGQRLKKKRTRNFVKRPLPLPPLATVSTFNETQGARQDVVTDVNEAYGLREDVITTNEAYGLRKDVITNRNEAYEGTNF